MKTHVTFLIILWVGMMAGAWAVPTSPLSSTNNGPLSDTVVVVDPGHGGTDPGFTWNETIEGVPYEFHEAGFTYRFAWSLAEALRSKGAVVYLTAWSPMMETPGTTPRESVFKPEDAIFLCNETGVNAKASGLRCRTEVAADALERYKGVASRILFISVHLDSTPGREGGFVEVDEGSSSVPDVAKTMAWRMVDAGYRHTMNGAERSLIVPRARGQRLPYVINGNHNPLKQRVLVELAAPSNSKNNSWMVRSPEARARLITAIVAGVEDLSNPQAVKRAQAAYGQEGSSSESGSGEAGPALPVDQLKPDELVGGGELTYIPPPAPGGLSLEPETTQPETQGNSEDLQEKGWSGTLLKIIQVFLFVAGILIYGWALCTALQQPGQKLTRLEAGGLFFLNLLFLAFFYTLVWHYLWVYMLGVVLVWLWDKWNDKEVGFSQELLWPLDFWFKGLGWLTR